MYYTMVYTYTGKNSYELQRKLDDAVSAFQDAHGELAIERVDASEVSADDIVQAVQSVDLFNPSKLIIIRNLSMNSELQERLEELLDRALDDNKIFIVDTALDKRKAYFKLLKKRTELHDFKDRSPHELGLWVRSEVKSAEGDISMSDASYLVERVGANQQLLHQEIEKLLLYNSSITKQSIESLTDRSLQSTVFDLLDAAFSGNKKKALRLYREQRAARVEPMYVVAMITWQLQNIALAVYAIPQSDATLIQAGMAPYSAKKSIQLARHIEKDDLKRMIIELSELDLKLKSSAVDADAALEFYFLMIISS